MKTVTEPLMQVVPRTSIRGLEEDFKSEPANVLLLEGETHWNRKPVMFFTMFFRQYLI